MGLFTKDKGFFEIIDDGLSKGDWSTTKVNKGGIAATLIAAGLAAAAKKAEIDASVSDEAIRKQKANIKNKLR